MKLAVESLSFSYGTLEVLRNIGFEAAPGTVTAILGPNGCGKSTLLRCLNGLLKPDAGRVLIDDIDLSLLSSRDIARRVGYVAQRNEAARLTAFDAVLLGRTPHLGFHVGRHDLEITQAVIQSMGLNELSMRYIDQMSGGELQRVCIARALAQEPSFLLLDEPTSSLDLRNQYDILGTVRHLAVEHGVTVLLTMHDLNSTLRVADRVIFLRAGEVFADGNPDEVTPDIVAAVYGIDVDIIYHDGRPVVIPLNGGHVH